MQVTLPVSSLDGYQDEIVEMEARIEQPKNARYAIVLLEKGKVPVIVSWHGSKKAVLKEHKRLSLFHDLHKKDSLLSRLLEATLWNFGAVSRYQAIAIGEPKKEPSYDFSC